MGCGGPLRDVPATTALCCPRKVGGSSGRTSPHPSVGSPPRAFPAAATLAVGAASGGVSASRSMSRWPATTDGWPGVRARYPAMRRPGVRLVRRFGGYRSSSVVTKREYALRPRQTTKSGRRGRSLFGAAATVGDAAPLLRAWPKGLRVRSPAAPFRSYAQDQAERAYDLRRGAGWKPRLLPF